MNRAAAQTISMVLFSELTEITLVKLMVMMVVAGLLIGVAFMSKELLELYRVHSQVSQISALDEAVAQFQEKYDGLQGDLLAVLADREGLPAGDGTPGHGDGDGKISPCTLDWQWRLGCETALFWSHLSLSGMIAGNFSADSRFTDDRLSHVGSMTPYLPEAAIGSGIYVTVWNSDESQPSRKPRLPYGNYYELSAISGVKQEKLIDNAQALTPEQAQAIDDKIDDGQPLSGRVVANGTANWPKESWGTYAKPGVSRCVFTDETYNTNYLLRARAPLCHLAIKLN